MADILQVEKPEELEAKLGSLLRVLRGTRLAGKNMSGRKAPFTKRVSKHRRRKAIQGSAEKSKRATKKLRSASSSP